MHYGNFFECSQSGTGMNNMLMLESVQYRIKGTYGTGLRYAGMPMPVASTSMPMPAMLKGQFTRLVSMMFIGETVVAAVSAADLWSWDLCFFYGSSDSLWLSLSSLLNIVSTVMGSSMWPKRKRGCDQRGRGREHPRIEVSAG
jgi:hypothetical protein